jgi:N-acetylmuramoyl-L-alanine amidase
VPGIAISFPGVSKGSQTDFSLAGSSHFATTNWSEDSNGTALTLQLKQPVSHRLTYTDAGWQLAFGTWIQKVEFASTDRGPRVRLTLDGPSTPAVRYSSAEEAIILTVGGATLAQGLPATISGDSNYVSQIKAEQVGSEVRLSVMLPRALAYHLQKVSETTWELAVTSPTLVNKVIALDPGHGAVDIGAPGTLGWHEADYTHDIAYRLRDLLTQAGAKVFMTRQYESGPIQGPARAAKINDAGADMFFSIHINSATNRSARGMETWFYPRGDNERFARLVQNSVLAELNSDWPDRGIKTSYNFIICRDTLTTGVMAELGFISNSTDQDMLHQASIRQRIAQGLFNAAEKYFAYE